jgi:predicted double-glycine peptidase
MAQKEVPGMSATPQEAYSIAYEKQLDAASNRTCGAAALAMVYRSLGKEVPQKEIWEKIAKTNQFGSTASTTHLMVADALSRGFDAVAYQARHPLFVLRTCRQAGVRVVLNHRLSRETGAGHYTVLADIGETNVTLHDPYLGPSRSLSHPELMELWQTRLNSEIAGNVLIAIAPRKPAEHTCEICRTPMPPAVVCPRCQKPVLLRPTAALGCIREACIVRLWNYLCCPSCDLLWNFGAAAPQPAEAAPAEDKPDGAGEPSKLELMFAELDKFCVAIAAMPEAQANPDVLKQLDFIKDAKEKLKQAQVDTLAMQQAKIAKMEGLAEEARQKEAAHRQKVEEINKPAPPLDGDALGRALLKNLGLTS